LVKKPSGQDERSPEAEIVIGNTVGFDRATWFIEEEEAYAFWRKDRLL